MPNTGDDDIELTEYADDSGTTSDGETFLLMEAEDFDGATNNRHSYLRLGAVDPAIKTQHNALAAGTAQTWDSTTGEDLASLVTEFVDDTRHRGAKDDATPDSTASKNTFHTMTQAERAAETATLHTKGGWRDHTDGNRVTTTRGDKVEVIRGNYKMRVLGRSQWTGTAGSGLHDESSGGVTYRYDEVPGQIIDVRWSNNEGTWTVMEECDTGHQVDRYHGVKKEWFQGGDIVDRVGTLAAYDASGDATTGWFAGDGDDFESDTDFDRPSDAPHGSASWPPNDHLPNVREETYADSVYEKTICKKYQAINGSWDRFVNRISETTYADSMTVEDHYDTYVGTSVAALTATEIWKGSFNEFYDGIGLSMKIGFFCDFRCGEASEITSSLGIAGIAMAVRIADLEAAVSFMDASFNAISLDFELGGAESEIGTVWKKRDSISVMRFTGALFLG